MQNETLGGSMRRVDRLFFLMLILCIGCDRGLNKNSPQPKVAQKTSVMRAAATLKPPTASDAVEKLLSAKVQELNSEVVLSRPEEKLTSGSTEYFSINSSGGKFTVVTAEFNGLLRNKRVYVFDELAGNLLFDSGKVQQLTTDVELTSFGLNDEWFIWLQTWDSSEEKLKRRSDLVAVDGSFDLAIGISHVGNDVAHTSTPQQAKGVGKAGMMFAGAAGYTNSKYLGKTKDGAEVPSTIYWDRELRVFSGASELEMDGVPAFRVDLEASKRFKKLY